MRLSNMLPLEKTFAGVIGPSPAPDQTSYLRCGSKPEPVVTKLFLLWLNSFHSQVFFVFFFKNFFMPFRIILHATENDWQPSVFGWQMSGSVTVPDTLYTSRLLTENRLGLVAPPLYRHHRWWCGITITPQHPALPLARWNLLWPTSSRVKGAFGACDFPSGGVGVW